MVMLPGVDSESGVAGSKLGAFIFKGWPSREKCVFKKTYNCSFIVRSRNGLRSTTSELLNLRVFLISKVHHASYA
jgi:hypothetical protein